jgi:protein SCO1/2
VALRPLGAVALASAVAAAGCGGTAARPPADTSFRGAAVPADTPAADFALRDERGAVVRLSAQRGRLLLLAFLYTRCTDVCPLVAQRLDRAVRSLGSRASAVRILAISVDPAGDTPAAARRYIRRHRLGPEFHWLVGTRQRLAPVWQGYNILVEPNSEEKIAHSAPVLLLDRRGTPRTFYPSTVASAAVAHDLRLLLHSS